MLLATSLLVSVVGNHDHFSFAPSRFFVLVASFLYPAVYRHLYRNVHDENPYKNNMNSHSYRNVHDKNSYKNNMDSHSYRNVHDENP